MRPGSLLVKRTFDLIFGASALVILSPLFFVLVLLVLVGVGRPILFRQERLGYKGQPFTLLKFRTMTDRRDDAGELLSDDDRITRIGRFLRSTSLDELPELINVLRGEMSLVGPRPLLAEYGPLYSVDQARRHEVPPGLAGPVMAEGRNALTWEEKFKWDVWYVDNWSLWLDFKILGKSVGKLISREGVSPEGRATMEKFQGSRVNGPEDR